MLLFEILPSATSSTASLLPQQRPEDTKMSRPRSNTVAKHRRGYQTHAESIGLLDFQRGVITAALPGNLSQNDQDASALLRRPAQRVSEPPNRLQHLRAKSEGHQRNKSSSTSQSKLKDDSPNLSRPPLPLSKPIHTVLRESPQYIGGPIPIPKRLHDGLMDEAPAPRTTPKLGSYWSPDTEDSLSPRLKSPGFNEDQDHWYNKLFKRKEKNEDWLIGEENE